MCDGEWGSDPDYYDLEFRQQNPDIYGNDEYMLDYNGRDDYSNQQRPSTKKHNNNNNNNNGIPIWVNIIAALIVYPLLIMTIIDACSN